MDSSNILHIEDLAALRTLERGNIWLRTILCTLARRGVAFRQSSPERCQQILQILSGLPLYKGGQFLFDLLEWEDFMLDGPPPDPLSSALDKRAFYRLATFLRHFKSLLDGDIDPDIVSKMGSYFQTATEVNEHDLEKLPQLEPGFYLYQDVVLGVIHSTSGLLINIEENLRPRDSTSND